MSLNNQLTPLFPLQCSTPFTNHIISRQELGEISGELGQLALRDGIRKIYSQVDQLGGNRIFLLVVWKLGQLVLLLLLSKWSSFILYENTFTYFLSPQSKMEIELQEKKSCNSTSSTQTRHRHLLYMKKLENKLNGEIGFNWWRRYISAALWDNLGTPVSLMITLLTAVSTAQANTGNFISDSANSTVTVVTLILSTLNTFFRPHTKVSSNIEIMKKYTEFGNKFEEIYYLIAGTDENYRYKIEQYKTLIIDINKYETNHGSDSINFFSDFIHIISRYLCLKRREKWLDFDKEFEDDKDIVV